MDLKERAKNYYNGLWHLPPSDKDLAKFAELILKEFIAELEDNITGVVWNYGFDTVIFKKRSKNGKKTLDQIKEEFLNVRGNAENQVSTNGVRTDGHNDGVEEVGGDNQLDKDKESEVQRPEQEETGEVGQEKT